LPLPEHPECFASDDGLGRSPGADVRDLQMPQGTVADVSKNHVGTALAAHNLDNILAVQPRILHKLKDRILRVRDHNPFGFAKMRRHLPISAIG
jgi:hypothetical protein